MPKRYVETQDHPAAVESLSRFVRGVGTEFIEVLSKFDLRATYDDDSVRISDRFTSGMLFFRIPRRKISVCNLKTIPTVR